MEDKAVEEIRKRRKDLINIEYHGSVKELTAALKELESRSSHKVADLYKQNGYAKFANLLTS